ncbi:carboxyl transferase domain-containing protein [Lachnospiraceae bacterium C1.1]|nr:carboxyl transferase domain-containing protein [Lachnospiraceae bacterium C1.1]
MSNLTTSSAGKRILSLLDENSFVEIGATVQARSTDFNLKPKDAPGDGVITGYGTINGYLVYVYSEDPGSLGGSVGEMHAKKIVNLYKLALKTGNPVVGLLDSTGMRLQEGTDALFAFGKIYKVMAKASGVIPQITAVFGNAGGGMSVLAGLSDFTFIEASKGKLFVNSPNAVKGNYEEKQDTASADYKAKAGAVDVVATEAEIYDSIRELLSFLPENCEQENIGEGTDDDLNRSAADMAGCAADTKLAIERIADNGAFFETRAEYAKNLVTGFIRLDDATVGVVANRTSLVDETGKEKEKFNAVLTVDAVRKAEKFVRFCDAFNIPILTLTNTTGFCTCENAEKYIANEAAKLAAAFVEADVAKVNVIVGNAFGTAAVVMNSKALGCDYTYAWDCAKIGAIDGRHAAEIMFDGESESVISEKAAEYDKLQTSSNSAAARGYVDTVIAPTDTRKYVIGAFEMLDGKDGIAPDRKHGTV